MRCCVAIVFFLFLSLNTTAQNKQRITEIRERIAEIDSLIRCRDCEIRIADGGLHGSLIIGGHRKILGIRFPTLVRGGGGTDQYFRFINCPDSIPVEERWFECYETERVYSSYSWVQQHLITRRYKWVTRLTYYQDGEKVAVIRGVCRSWRLRHQCRITRSRTRFYNDGRVIYRDRTRERR